MSIFVWLSGSILRCAFEKYSTSKGLVIQMDLQRSTLGELEKV
jgi:hypothetical protein